MTKNTLHFGSHSARVKHNFVWVCKCKPKLLSRGYKCSKCRSEENE